jgi:hypothetical protein
MDSNVIAWLLVCWAFLNLCWSYRLMRGFEQLKRETQQHNFWLRLMAKGYDRER